MSEGEAFLDGRVTLHAGDSREVVRGLADNSVDSVVTDPPYALVSIGKRFGADNAAPAKVGKTGAYARASSGFMGKKWDTGETAFAVEFWQEILRVVKPGGHVVAFGGTRSYHRLACAIEDAGFEIRDQLAWTYGSGFPKSHDVSKAIDRALGAERTKVRIDTSNVRNSKATGGGRDGMEGASRPWIEAAMKNGYHEAVSDEAVSDEAVSWQGWGTALKPSWEPIVLARKPLSEETVAANVLQHGTGALNIIGTRIGTRTASTGEVISDNIAMGSPNYGRVETDETTIGRWPANLVHDGSPEVLAAFPESIAGAENDKRGTGGIWSPSSGMPCGPQYGDSGSAARFFYTAKADASDRLGSKHPTVKPVDLMQWLIRLITPPGGTVLEPFAGTGTTGEAAFREGFRAILIEREAEYQNDIRRRMALCVAGPDERSRESIKARLGDAPQDHGPLFGVIA